MPKLTHERLSEILSPMGAEPYSGRGMMGRQCLSVTTQDGQSLLDLIADVVECCDGGECEAASVLRQAKTDDMGRGSILYWPSVKMPAEAVQ